MRHKDGSWRMLSWRSMPRGNLMFATARDVTDDVRASQELRDAKEQLETRVAERTRDLEQANEYLRQSERRFRALIENSADCISLTDADRHFQYVSPSVTRIEGYSPEELLGSLATDQTHPDDLAMLARAMETLFTSPGKPIPALWRRRHKDGRWIWLEGVATNLLDDPSVRAVVCNYRDITDRLAHERARRRTIAAAGAAVAYHARHRRTPGPAQHLPGGGAPRRRRSAGRPVLHLPVRLGGQSPDRELRRPAQRAAGSASSACEQDSILPIDENGLGRCVHGYLVYEPDISAAQLRIPAAPGEHRHALAGDRAAAGGEPRVRRADLRAARGRLVQQRRMRVPAARPASTRRWPRTRRSSTPPCNRPTTICARRSSRSCSRNGCGRSARWPAASRTTSTMRSRRCRCTPKRCSSTSPAFRHAAASSWKSSSARSTTWRRPWRAWASSIALREPEIALSPLDLNLLVEQVVDLTRVRWSDMAQQRGVSIELKLELDAALPRIGGVQSQMRDALVNLVFNAVDAMPEGRHAADPHAQCRRRRPERCGGRSHRQRRRHGRGNPAALSRTVLHHQGHTRHGSGFAHGVRRRATSRRPAGDREYPGQGHHAATGIRGVAQQGRYPAQICAVHARRPPASSSSMTIRCCSIRCASHSNPTATK